jgi:hypothetical protein
VTRRVVVTKRLSATETLEKRVRRKNHLLDALNPTRSPAPRNRRNVLHNPLRRLRLSRTRLARDDDTLVVLVREHVVVGALGNGIDVRNHFETVLPSVGFERRVVIDGEHAEGVDGDEDVADIRLRMTESARGKG